MLQMTLNLDRFLNIAEEMESIHAKPANTSHSPKQNLGLDTPSSTSTPTDCPLTK
jgi:hypothetical protein